MKGLIIFIGSIMFLSFMYNTFEMSQGMKIALLLIVGAILLGIANEGNGKDNKDNKNNKNNKK